MSSPMLRDAALGALSGLAAWAGSFLLPEGSLLMQLYPGAIFGLAMFFLRAKPAVETAVARWRALFWCLVAAIASWRFAVDVAFPHGDPLPFAVAGTAGGFIVALGCLMAWRPLRWRFDALALITACGAAGGLLYQGFDALRSGLAESLWVLLLLVEWQTLVAIGIGVARRRRG